MEENEVFTRDLRSGDNIMKILNINSYYYSSTVHRQLQEALYAKGIDSLTYVPLAKGYKAREECRYGDEKYVQTSECYNRKDRYIFHVKHNKILKDLEQKMDLKCFNCLHAHSLFSNGYVAMKIKKKYGIPYIVAVRDTDLNTFFKYMLFLRRTGIKILKEADKIVFLSASYRDSTLHNYIPKNFRTEFFAKSVVIPNGIDDYWIDNRGPIKRIPSNKTLKLIYAGAVSKRKNIGATVKAAKILNAEKHDVVYTVVGKRVDQSSFDQIKGSSCTRYVEPVSKEKLLQIYRENDIFVMPSITETFGLTYAEAMSQGLPVIYSKGQGFDGQFEDGKVGYRVDCHDSHEIAEKIKAILNDYETISQNAINGVEKFRWRLIAEKYNEIYCEGTQEKERELPL